jgi:hypothetical protein
MTQCRMYRENGSAHFVRLYESVCLIWAFESVAIHCDNTL